MEERPPFFTPAVRAFTAPFLVFMLFLPLVQGVRWLGEQFGADHLLLTHPEHWLYPLQTLICLGLLWHYRAWYPLTVSKSAKAWLGTLGVAILVLVIWVSPQEIFGVAPRLDGFNPEVLETGSPLYWSTLFFRFLRLVVAVPLLEEIFWRGFLMRYLIKEDFQSVAFGTFTRFSFFVVAIAFAAAHQQADWAAAFLTSLLYNGIAVRTRNLLLCVVAHAITNLLLGLYILRTLQWGFW